ncbi:MAG: DUF6150 family protein [Pseudomonadota bacterium]
MARIYRTYSMGDAQLLVALVERGRAQLLVHRVDCRGFARGPAHWFITRDRHEASTRVFFTSQGMAQLKVCFVDTEGEAGWQGKKPPGLHLD